MNKFDSLPDGEYFVDKPIKETIPEFSTWESMSANQLIDVQVQLQNKMWEMRSNATISKALQSKLTELQALLAKRMAEER